MQRCACGNSDTARFRRYWDGDEDEQSLLGVACAPCGQEWLQGEYLNTEGEGRLVFGESEFRKNVTVSDAVQTSLQVRGSRTKIGRNDIHLLKPADHITWHRPYIIWASSRENLSSGFPKERDSNQSAQLQRLARKIKFRLKQA